MVIIGRRLLLRHCKLYFYIEIILMAGDFSCAVAGRRSFNNAWSMYKLWTFTIVVIGRRLLLRHSTMHEVLKLC